MINFTGTSLYRLLVVAVPVEKPPSVVTSDQPFFDTGTSTRGLSTGVTVGVPVPVMFQ